PDLAELIVEMSDRTASGYLFGGLASSRGATAHIADGVWQGGLSGVAFTRDVALISRVTQGSQPLGPTRTITACERNVVTQLDGQPALQALLSDLGLQDLEDPRQAVSRLRATLVGLTDEHDTALARGGQFGPDTRVRHLIGVDPAQQAVAVSELLQPGMKLAFCQRDVAAARRDLVRICSEIRDEVESHAESAVPGAGAAASAPGDAAGQILGAIYVSCSGRGGPHFGGPSAELKIVQHALGDVPLVGFFAGGEIARHHLYGYTGVLTVFTAGHAA
ncbi:MAG: FIST C-terminal domain-containing protein, partial [Burkholderiaceae bacterium]|nr:FIST C-terminal domain-containing protein [Burkholderiaceae bacterium]